MFYLLGANICAGLLPPKAKLEDPKYCIMVILGMWGVTFWSWPVALTRSTSLSISEVSEGKCRLTRSATLSFRSTLGTASLSPSPEDWTTGIKDRCSRTSLRKSARPPEPARTSQGMLFLRERSTLWCKSKQKGEFSVWMEGRKIHEKKDSAPGWY